MMRSFDSGSKPGIDGSDALQGIETDRDLLDKVRLDDPSAFDLFVRRYGDKIFGFGMKVCGEPEDARDVAQDTLLTAFQSLKSVKEPAALRTWLYRVVSNACLMKRRRGKFAPKRELSLDELMPAGPEDASREIPDVSNLPEDAAVRGELQQAVREAILTLPYHYRVVVVLRDMEELSTQETAEALDLPISTVKMRLHRGRLMLRKELIDRFGERTMAEA